MSTASNSEPTSVDSASADASLQASDNEMSEIMKRVLSLDNASQEEKNQYRLRQVLKDFQLHPSDTGSPEVQIALLTERMAQLAEHVRAHRKDHNTKRGLIQIVSDRRCLLKYLKREDEDRYQKLIARLGIRDVISLLPPRCFLPAKAALAAAAKSRQRAQAKVQEAKTAAESRARGKVRAQRRADDDARRLAADQAHNAKRAAADAAAAAAAGGAGSKSG